MTCWVEVVEKEETLDNNQVTDSSLYIVNMAQV